MNSLIKELKERGLYASTSGNLEELLSTPTTFYVGTDPTADSLHVGHFISLMVASHMQKAGHKPIILMGGGTAAIGDPSGKTDMRNMLTIE